MGEVNMTAITSSRDPRDDQPFKYVKAEPRDDFSAWPRSRVPFVDSPSFKVVCFASGGYAEHEAVYVVAATSITEQLEHALGDLKRIVTSFSAAADCSFHTDELVHEDEDGDTIHLCMLMATLQQGDRNERLKITEECLDYIANHNDRKVRELLTISIR